MVLPIPVGSSWQLHFPVAFSSNVGQSWGPEAMERAPSIVLDEVLCSQHWLTSGPDTPQMSFQGTSSGKPHSCLSHLFLTDWRRWREASWLPFQPPKVRCNKEPGMDWLSVISLKDWDMSCVLKDTNWVHVQLQKITWLFPDKQICRHVSIKPSSWVTYFETIHLFLTRPVHTDIR